MATLDMAFLRLPAHHTAPASTDTQYLEVPTQTLHDLVNALQGGVRFPGRVRVLGDAQLAPQGLSLPPAGEWVGIGGAMTVAAACGVAVAEAARGGEVVALVSDDAPDDLPAALALSNLTVLVVDPAGREAAASRCSSALHGARCQGLALDVTRRPVATDAVPPSSWLRRREWPPVQLASLPRSGQCPWPAVADRPLEAVVLGACRFLARNDPSLVLVSDDPLWSRCAASPQRLMAVAQLAGEGRRVVAVIDPEQLAGAGEVLTAIGRRQLGIKLLCRPGAAGGTPALPELLGDGPLSRWWVQGSSDPAETEMMLAQVLAHEEPALVLLGAPGAAAPAPYERGQAWTVGSGRLIAEGADALLVCHGGELAPTLLARMSLASSGLSVAVWQCTSLAPLPQAGLRALQAARPGSQPPPVVCVDAGGGAFARALTQSGVLPRFSTAAGSAEAVALVRAACAR